MTITKVKTPDTVSPVKNPITLQLQTDNHFSDAGDPAYLTFIFTGTDVTAGHLFTLSWGTLEITFTLAASPDGSGNQIHTATMGQSVTDWMDVFAADLANNYYILRDFLIEVDHEEQKIYLESKEKGSEYSVTVDAETLTDVSVVVLAGVDPVPRDNYELICLTEVLENGAWISVKEDRSEPDEDGNCEFELSDIIDAELEAEHTWPEEPGTYHAQCSSIIKKYRYSYAELYENSVKKLTVDTSALYAILGTFDYKMAAGLNGADYSLIDFVTTYKNFLTWQPLSKTINRTQPEKLYFLVFNDISSLELHIKVYYTDGTNSGDQELETISPVSQYEVYELMIGYSQIDFSKISSKEVSRYEIWLEDDAGNVQSQIREYVLDTRTYRNERIFLFRNSFGGFDTLRATGRRVHTNEYERMILERNNDDFTLQEQYLILERSVFSINTGWLTFAQRNWLRELLLSGEVYELFGDYKFPVILTDERRELRDDENYLHSLEFNYKYAFKDPAYTGDYTQMPLLAENFEVLLNENGEPLYA